MNRFHLAVALATALAFAVAAPATAQPPAGQGGKEQLAPYARDFGKTLIIVYSVTGNTLDMAERIQARTGGDIERIETEEVYPAGDQLIPYAKEQRDALIKPNLIVPLPDVSGYDTVFLGTPVWFHELPPATALFLAAFDFQGKRLAPFLTCGGGPGDSLHSLRHSAKNAKVMEGKVLTRYASRPAEDIDKEIDLWLAALLDGAAVSGSGGNSGPGGGEAKAAR
ncbi:MAG: hypothetical protein LBR80_03355 [Deltaproteobacteria bacterium]|jgi:flavodoxin|nr:hypothetical protein [Deltaproteobacteria bacterium]